MHDDTPKRRLQRLRNERSQMLRQLTIQLGENLLASRGVVLPTMKTDGAPRIARMEAYRDLVRHTIGEQREWTRWMERAGTLGMQKEAQFREQMVNGMGIQLRRYKDALRQLLPTPRSLWTEST